MHPTGQGAVMPMTFNQALGAYGIDLREVRLLRHQTRGEGRRTPYTLWRDDRALFEAYQATQHPKNRTRLGGALWASFVVTPYGRTLFAGLYSVGGWGPLPAEWPYPLNERGQGVEDELYTLTHVELFAEFEGRLYIDWGAGTRSWVQRADQQDKPIEEIARRFAEPPFPGFSAFREPLSRIASLPPGWVDTLRNVRGVYVLTCPRTLELYIGSASGENGFIGRWGDYVKDGHGGNVMLKGREPSDFQVSILEVAGSLASASDIVALETRWKLKLQTREMGLTAN